MFFISIVWSLVFLALVWMTARAQGRTTIALLLGAFFLFSSFCVLFSVTATLQVLCVSALVLFAGASKMPASAFRRGVVAASLIGFGLASTLAIAEVARIRNLAKKYPFESMAPRLAYEEQRRAATTITSGANMQPVSLNSRWSQIKFPADYHHRTAALEKIHRSSVEHFIDAQAFGVGRMIDLANDRFLETPEYAAIEQPSGMPDDGTPELGESVAGSALRSRDNQGFVSDRLTPDEIWNRHASDLAIFLSPDRNGLIRDRDHVAGFIPHQISHGRSEANEEKAYEGARIELVSLLKFDEPRVYISKYLPRMEDLKSAPTRPLDSFEQPALTNLEQGEDIVSVEEGDKFRALGALRALKICLQCHTAREGDLLGAFSYTWWIKPTAQPPAESAGSSAGDGTTSHESLQINPAR